MGGGGKKFLILVQILVFFPSKSVYDLSGGGDSLSFILKGIRQEPITKVMGSLIRKQDIQFTLPAS